MKRKQGYQKSSSRVVTLQVQQAVVEHVERGLDVTQGWVQGSELGHRKRAPLGLFQAEKGPYKRGCDLEYGGKGVQGEEWMGRGQGRRTGESHTCRLDTLLVMRSSRKCLGTGTTGTPSFVSASHTFDLMDASRPDVLGTSSRTPHTQRT